MEKPTFEKLIEDIKWKNAIDLACGGGFYTRIIRNMTDGLVYGVDLSKGMINYANLQESSGIHYL